MIEPVMCGCGGKPTVEVKPDNYGKPYYYVSCEKCLTVTGGYSYGEAVKIWNTAMSGNRVRIHHVVFSDDIESAKPYHDDRNPKRWICGACHSAVKKPWKFCQNCGLKLDWKEE